MKKHTITYLQRKPHNITPTTIRDRSRACDATTLICSFNTKLCLPIFEKEQQGEEDFPPPKRHPFTS